MQLAGGGGLLGAVRAPVDHHPAGTADALPAVVGEGDGLDVVVDEALVDDVEHLQERAVLGDVVGVDVEEAARLVRPGLAPDPQLEPHPGPVPVAVPRPLRN